MKRFILGNKEPSFSGKIVCRHSLFIGGLESFPNFFFVLLNSAINDSRLIRITFQIQKHMSSEHFDCANDRTDHQKPVCIDIVNLKETKLTVPPDNRFFFTTGKSSAMTPKLKYLAEETAF